MNVSNLLDIVLLVTSLLCAGDALRQLDAMKHPIRSVAFALLAIASFGWLSDVIRGLPVPGWAFALHALLAIYAVAYFATRHPLGLPHADSTRRRLPPSVPPSLRR